MRSRAHTLACVTLALLPALALLALGAGDRVWWAAFGVVPALALWWAACAAAWWWARRRAAAGLAVVLCGAGLVWAAQPSGVGDARAAAARGVSREAVLAALRAYDCAAAQAQLTRPTLAIIDFSRPSFLERLTLIHLDTGSVSSLRVAHGEGSGGTFASMFSDAPGSHQSSLGLYRAAEVYTGTHGRSLRLDGLEPSNRRARERDVVIHGADYATSAFVWRHGRLGRSWGCPAVAPSQVDTLIDALRDGGALYAWYPSSEWLQTSPWLRCAGAASS